MVNFFGAKNVWIPWNISAPLVLSNSLKIKSISIVVPKGKQVFLRALKFRLRWRIRSFSGMIGFLGWCIFSLRKNFKNFLNILHYLWIHFNYFARMACEMYIFRASVGSFHKCVHGSLQKIHEGSVGILFYWNGISGIIFFENGNVIRIFPKRSHLDPFSKYEYIKLLFVRTKMRTGLISFDFKSLRLCQIRYKIYRIYSYIE